MKGIIVYKGKYGATRQYAGWVGSALHLPAVVADNVSADDLIKSEYVVIGSSVYIGKLQLRYWLKKNISVIQNKKLFLFIVCATPPDQKNKLETIARENIPEEIRNRCEVFFVRGRMIKKNISLPDRFLLKIGSLLVKDPGDKKNMLLDFDAVKKENIIPLINAINAFDVKNPDSALSHALFEN